MNIRENVGKDSRPAAGPPRVFGILLSLLGFALAGGGLHLNVNLGGGGAYFLVVGLLILVSGLLLVVGKPQARIAYGIALAVVWVWSIRDAGANVSELIPRVALPTLLAFYIFSPKMRRRLSPG